VSCEDIRTPAAKSFAPAKHLIFSLPEYQTLTIPQNKTKQNETLSNMSFIRNQTMNQPIELNLSSPNRVDLNQSFDVLALLNGKPIKNLKVEIIYPDGTKIIKRTNEEGKITLKSLYEGIILIKTQIGDKTYTKKIFVIPKGKELYTLFYGLSYLIVDKNLMSFILWIILLILAIIDAIILRKKYLSKMMKLFLWAVKWILATIITLISTQLFLDLLPLFIIFVILDNLLFKRRRLGLS